MSVSSFTEYCLIQSIIDILQPSKKEELSIGKYEVDVETPHLKLPESGVSSSIRILKSIVTARSSSEINAILSSRPTVNLTFLSISTPSAFLHISSTESTSLPSSLSGVNPIYGYFLLDAGISSTVIFSRSFLLDVAWLDFDLLAENRSINDLSSLIFSSAFLFCCFIIR